MRHFSHHQPCTVIREVGVNVLRAKGAMFSARFNSRQVLHVVAGLPRVRHFLKTAIANHMWQLSVKLINLLRVPCVGDQYRQWWKETVVLTAGIHKVRVGHSEREQQTSQCATCQHMLHTLYNCITWSLTNLFLLQIEHCFLNSTQVIVFMYKNYFNAAYSMHTLVCIAYQLEQTQT